METVKEKEDDELEEKKDGDEIIIVETATETNLEKKGSRDGRNNGHKDGEHVTEYYHGPMYERKYATDNDKIDADAFEHAFPLYRHIEGASNSICTEGGTILSACFATKGGSKLKIMPAFLVKQPTLAAMEKANIPGVEKEDMLECIEALQKKVTTAKRNSRYLTCTSNTFQEIDFDIHKKGPLVFRSILEEGAVVRDGIEISGEYIGQLPWNTLIMVDKIAFTQNTYYFGPKHQLIRLRLANNMQIPGLNLSRSQMQGKRLWVSLYYNSRDKNEHPYYRTAYDLLYKSKATSEEPGSLTFVFDLVGWAKTYFPACRSIEQKENHRNLSENDEEKQERNSTEKPQNKIHNTKCFPSLQCRQNSNSNGNNFVEYKFSFSNRRNVPSGGIKIRRNKSTSSDWIGTLTWDHPTYTFTRCDGEDNNPEILWLKVSYNNVRENLVEEAEDPLPMQKEFWEENGWCIYEMPRGCKLFKPCDPKKDNLIFKNVLPDYVAIYDDDDDDDDDYDDTSAIYCPDSPNDSDNYDDDYGDDYDDTSAIYCPDSPNDSDDYDDTSAIYCPDSPNDSDDLEEIETDDDGVSLFASVNDDNVEVFDY